MKEKTENKDLSRLSRMTDKAWWFPVVCDEAYFDRLRADYPEKAGMTNDELRSYFNEDRKYECLWDHIGDAYEEWEPLADAYLDALLRIKELEDGSCRFNCRKVGKLHKIIDRIEKYTEKTPHAPKHRLVLYSDLQDLIRERKGEVKD